MRLESALDLKHELMIAVDEADAERAYRGHPFAFAAGDIESVDLIQPSLAFGIHPRGKGDYWLAVRVQRPELAVGDHLSAIKDAAAGEVDIQFVGEIRPQNMPNLTDRHRPLLMGSSIGHFKVTAGTLGAFVQDGDGSAMLLSNHHVLANLNEGTAGDAVVQPGPYDKGIPKSDRVGELTRGIELRKDRPNRADCAVARIDTGIEFDSATIPGLGKLTGVADSGAALDSRVFKVGRTSGLTEGMITATQLDHVIVTYPGLGNLRFDGQLEIQGVGKRFSQPGDSGALIVTSEGQGIGLLFSGNSLGRTWAHELAYVLDALGVVLLAGV